MIKRIRQNSGVASVKKIVFLLIIPCSTDGLVQNFVSDSMSGAG